MAQSDRRRQRKADAKKRREKERASTQAKRAKVLENLADFRRKAATIKRFLKQRGYEQKFYDYLDSYGDAFVAEVEKAKHECPSLLGVHEVEDGDYYLEDDAAIAAKCGYTGLTQVFFKGKDVDDEYLARDRKSNINGKTIAFRDGTGELRTLVLIRKTVVNVSNSEFKYGFKLIALLHEIGHVKDWERGINLKEGEVAILDAEVFANEFALRRLMEGDYRAALSTLLPALEKLREGDGYRRVVADRLVPTELFRTCEEFVKTNWNDHLSTKDAIARDLLDATGSLSAFMRFSRD